MGKKEARKRNDQVGKVLGCPLGKFRRSTHPDRFYFIGKSHENAFFAMHLPFELLSRNSQTSGNTWSFNILEFTLFLEILRNIIFSFVDVANKFAAQFLSFPFLLNIVSWAGFKLKFLLWSRCFIDDRVRDDRIATHRSTNNRETYPIVSITSLVIACVHFRLYLFHSRLICLVRWLSFVKLSRKVRTIRNKTEKWERRELNAVDFRQRVWLG